MKTFVKVIKFAICLLIAFIIFCVLFYPFGSFVLAVMLTTLFSFVHDVSSNPQYSPLYHQTFETQQELVLNQWSDTRSFYLDTYHSSWKDQVEIVDKGTKLKVKKITLQMKWAGKDLKILVEIDDPKFSAHKANSSKTIDACQLLTDWWGCTYGDKIAEFDPDLLRNVKIKTLRQAVQYGDFEAVKRLIENGADVNEKMNGLTPIFFANQYEIVKILIENGANIHQRDKDGNTPLHIAIIKDCLECVDSLLKFGADPFATNDDQQTALHYAASDLKLVKLLEEAGALNQK